MIILSLLWSFIKIGFTSFGGLSMIPLISSEMLSHGWMTSDEVTDIVAIAEMTPGPLGLNCATFAGMKTGGILGAIAANLGVLMPTFTVMAAVAVFFERFKKSTAMQRVMVGVRPSCIGMIYGVAVSLSLTNYTSGSSICIPAIILGIIDLFLLIKIKISIPKVIGLNAALGLLIFGVLGL